MDAAGGDHGKRRLPRAGIVLAWIAILAMGAIQAQWGVLRPEESFRRMDEQAAVQRMPQAAWYELDRNARDQETHEGVSSWLRSWSGGSAARRLRYAVLVAHLRGAKEARAVLQHMDALDATKALTVTEGQREVRRILGSLYEGPLADGPWGLEKSIARLPPADAEALRRDLEWFGRLALEPNASSDALARVGDPRPASRGSVLSFRLLESLLPHFGLILLIVVLPLLLIRGRISSGLGPPVPWHGVLAEAAAVFLVVETAMPARFLPVGRAAFEACWLSIRLAAVCLGLSWLRVRGVSTGEALGSTGWTRGRGLAKEIGIGVLAYALVAAGRRFLWFVLPGGPDHAFSSDLDLLSGNTVLVVLAVFGGLVVAPFQEETTYRGLLYRHLREATRGFPVWASSALAISVTGLLFASMHTGGPAHFATRFLFAAIAALLFEWRGSLWAPMALHATNNLLYLTGTALTGY